MSLRQRTLIHKLLHRFWQEVKLDSLGNERLINSLRPRNLFLSPTLLLPQAVILCPDIYRRNRSVVFVVLVVYVRRM